MNKFDQVIRLYEKNVGLVDTIGLSDLEKDLLKFLVGSKSLKLKNIAGFAESNKLTNDDLIETLAKFGKLFAQFALKGEANKTNTTEESVDQDQLKTGIKIEMEHTNNPDIAKRIAVDHLAEIKDYYTRLVKMEKDAEKELKK